MTTGARNWFDHPPLQDAADQGELLVRVDRETGVAHPELLGTVVTDDEESFDSFTSEELAQFTLRADGTFRQPEDPPPPRVGLRYVEVMG